jgi:hypothetical protein
MQLLKHAFAQNSDEVFPGPMNPPIVQSQMPHLQTLFSLVAMVKGLEEAGLEWKDLREPVKYGIEAAMVCERL